MPSGIGSTPPRVTVLLPVRDGAAYLAEAVDSVLAQTYRDLVLLVVDDGSTDRTGEVLDAYRGHPQVRVERQEPAGMAAALNRGLALSPTELVARMDADDRSEPGRLAAQVALLDHRPDVVVVGTRYRTMDAEGRPGRAEHVLRRDADLRRLLHVASPFAHGSVMFRRSAVVAAGGYDASRWPADDYDLWCRLGGGFANLAQVLYHYREHPGGSSRPEQERQAARIAAELRTRRPVPPLRARDLLAGAHEHRHELRWYLRQQRWLAAALRDAPAPPAQS